MNNNVTLRATWVLKNKLLLGSVPKTFEDIDFLKKKAISGILNLSNECDPEIEKLLRQDFAYRKFFLPDHRDGRDPTLMEIDSVLKALEEIYNNKIVYIHCSHGIERSPLICIAWLVKEKKMSIENAAYYLNNIHERSNPLNRQLIILRDYFENKTT